MPQTGARPETGRRRTSRNGAVAFTIIVFAAACALVLACAQLLAGGIGLAALVIAVVVGALAASSVHIVMEWERAVVMRFGRFNRVAGPGIVFTWPVIEFYTVRIDQRVAATYFGAEETLTSDLVPVNVDAVVFWMVFSPKKAAVEVEDYASAVAWMAQAMLRKAIGRASLAEVACRRDQLDAELKDELEAKLDGWGIDVIDVEVRDIVVPRELQASMAAGAVAVGVAALDHEAVNNTVESQPVIEMLLCQLHKVGNADRRCIRIQFHLDGAVILHFNFRMVDAGKGL